MAPAAKIVNLYGPTEATVFSTSYTFDPLDPPQSEWVPIGEPFHTVLARIDTTLTPGNPTGELLLSGPQVIERYWGEGGDPSRHFAVDTHTDGRRWYRTGDLVSHDARYGYVFHGRADHQVKVRGFRIELQEIEATLRRWLPDQQIAVVVACCHDDQEAQLVAFCNRLHVDRDELARQCGLDLPSYMVPHVFIALSPFPVNANGKTDYLGLKRIACATLSESLPILTK
jgi:D-alanine--poly(phosphoribitol) ligase subunit 1